MYYIKEYDENGEYTKDGKRYSVRGVNRACTPQGDNVGYTFFDSDEAMLAEWGLIKLPPEVLVINSSEYFSQKTNNQSII